MNAPPSPVPSASPPVPDGATAARAFAPLHEELALWQKAGRSCPFWWRDDDLTTTTPALRMLSDMAERNGAPVLMAVIPARADAMLAKDTAGMSRLSFCQHGLRHFNHQAAGQPPSEFGTARPLAAVAADLREGYARMQALFGERFLPLFVPPWNRLRPDAVSLLELMGIRGISTYQGESDGFDAVLRVVDVHMDILVWSPKPPIACRPIDDLVGRIVAQLHVARASPDKPAPVGILTHHRPMQADSWAFMQRLFDATAAWSCVRWMSASELFPA
jgi:hypothetical protein